MRPRRAKGNEDVGASALHSRFQTLGISLGVKNTSRTSAFFEAFSSFFIAFHCFSMLFISVSGVGRRWHGYLLHPRALRGDPAAGGSLTPDLLRLADHDLEPHLVQLGVNSECSQACSGLHQLQKLLDLTISCHSRL